MRSKVTPTQRALNFWAVILIIWAIYRAKFKFPEWIDELIAKPLVFIFPVYYYIKKIEKKSFFSAIDLKLKISIPDLLISLIIGGIFSFSAIMANILKFKRVIFFQRSLNAEGLLFMIIVALATGISEEILSRGFVLKRLYEESKNIYTSSFFASILFFFLHVPILFTNSRLTGDLLLMVLATDMILSLVNSFVFLERRNLLVPILIHAFYNLSIILFV